MREGVCAPAGVAFFWKLHQPGERDWQEIESYFFQAPEAEVWLLMRLLAGLYWYPRTPAETLIRAAARWQNLPEALLRHSCEEAGDTGEALTLILIPPHRPPAGFPENLSLWLLRELPALLIAEERLQARLPILWQNLCQEEAFFLHKVLLHSAHLPAFRLKTKGPPKKIHSLLQRRWQLSRSELSTLLRRHLSPPSGLSPSTLF